MDAVKSAKQRLRQYPVLLTQCSEAAKKYATCAISNANLSKDNCLAEFEELKRCLLKAATDKKTRL